MEQLKEVLSLTANFVTVTGFSFAFVWGILKKTKTPMGLKINQFMNGLLKMGVLVIFYMVFIPIFGDIYKFVYTSLDGIIFLERINFLKSALAYFSVFATAVPFYWTLTVKFDHILYYISEAIRKWTFNIKPESKGRLLRIVKAEYKTDDSHSIDVSDKIRRMVFNNKLKITPTNELAGDPHRGHVKNLVIDYNVGGIANKAVIKEGETKIIPG
jgi:hypothetical protein